MSQAVIADRCWNIFVQFSVYIQYSITKQRVTYHGFLHEVKSGRTTVSRAFLADLCWNICPILPSTFNVTLPNNGSLYQWFCCIYVCRVCVCLLCCLSLLFVVSFASLWSVYELIFGCGCCCCCCCCCLRVSVYCFLVLWLSVSVCLSACLSVCLPVCQSVCLPAFCLSGLSWRITV